MDYTLELIVLPVADVDVAKDFYENKLGFTVDVDHVAGPDVRVVQLTPPGSACSITVMKPNRSEPGSAQGLHLCVSDIEKAREELAGRGLEIGDFFHFGEAGQTPGLDPQRRSYGTFLSFRDPDGNGWLVQEVVR